MIPINERIKAVRKDAGLTLEKFGERIGISNSACSLLETGRNNPSEQTIRAICREFDINEEWLRTGRGEMKLRKDRAALIVDYVARLLGEENAELQRTIISIMASLPPELWQAAEDCARKIRAEELEKQE